MNAEEFPFFASEEQRISDDVEYMGLVDSGVSIFSSCMVMVGNDKYLARLLMVNKLRDTGVMANEAFMITGLAHRLYELENEKFS